MPSTELFVTNILWEKNVGNKQFCRSQQRRDVTAEERVEETRQAFITIAAIIMVRACVAKNDD